MVWCKKNNNETETKVCVEILDQNDKGICIENVASKVITETPTQSFNTIVIDNSRSNSSPNNYRYILTIQCELTEHVIACTMKNANSIGLTY